MVRLRRHTTRKNSCFVNPPHTRMRPRSQTKFCHTRSVSAVVALCLAVSSTAATASLAAAQSAPAAPPLFANPAATFTGSAGFGSSVSLSADGQAAIVGNGAARVANVYAETKGRWPTAPEATFSHKKEAYYAGNDSVSTALSGNGQVALMSVVAANAVYVYHRAGSGWESAALPIPNGANISGPVALSANGRLALVAATKGAAMDNVGYVYSETPTWHPVLVATLTDPSTTNESVALSANGQVAAVGNGYGPVYLYREVGGIWHPNPVAALATGADEHALGTVSVALSADGQEALIGIAHLRTGSAILYSDDAGVWHRVANLGLKEANFSMKVKGFPTPVTTPVDLVSPNGSVALSADGDAALVGEDGGTLFYRYQDGAWHLAGAIPLGDVSLSLSGNGDVALLGSFYANAANTKGAAYIYNLNGTGS